MTGTPARHTVQQLKLCKYLDDLEVRGCPTPIPSMEPMYGIFTYIWLIFMVRVNVGKYTIHVWDIHES